jgi:hypothetical protein
MGTIPSPSERAAAIIRPRQSELVYFSRGIISPGKIIMSDVTNHLPSFGLKLCFSLSRDL